MACILNTTSNYFIQSRGCMLMYKTESNGTAAARTCFLGLDLGKVVVVRDQVGHDGLVIRAGNINICEGVGRRVKMLCKQIMNKA